jgi:hypothetical protein
MKIAVITPYFNEPFNVLQRCHESVAKQRDLKDASITHFFVADGEGLEAVASLPRVRHISLGASHNDNGNTPRTAGGLSALREGFDGICYLDADNLYDSLHVSSVIKAREESGSEVIFSGRYWFFPDGDCYDLAARVGHEDAARRHADTSCISLFGSARRAASLWGEMPVSLGPVCDRVFFQYLTSNHSCSWTDQKTVFFETWYEGAFSKVAIPQPWNSKVIPPQSKDQWLADFQQFARYSPTPLSLRGAKIWTRPKYQGIRLLQITSTAEKQPSNFITSLSQIRGFVPDPKGAWDGYLIKKFPELTALNLQEIRTAGDAGANVAEVLDAATLVNDQLGQKLLSDLGPYQSKHLRDHGRLTICTSSVAVLDNLRVAVKQRVKLDKLVTKKIVFVGPPAFFTDSAEEEINRAHVVGDRQSTGRGDTKFISRLEVDRYCEVISSTAVGCGAQQVLMIPAIYCDTVPSRVLLHKVEHFVKFGPKRALRAPARKVFNLKEHFDFFSAHDKYERELAAMAHEIQRRFEGGLIENNSEGGPSLEDNQKYEWSRVHHSFWHHREDFAPFFEIPAPERDPTSDFQVIRSVERAARILEQRKEMASKYGFI